MQNFVTVTATLPARIFVNVDSMSGHRLRRLPRHRRRALSTRRKVSERRAVRIARDESKPARPAKFRIARNRNVA